MGKQLNMNKRLYENQIMRKALLNDLNAIFKTIEYTQNSVYASQQMSGSKFWGKIADKLANAKFYFLSATFVLIKSIDELEKTTLEEHFEANRPPEYHGAPPVSPRVIANTLYNMTDLTKEKIKTYSKYKNNKFDEYLGYFVENIKEVVKKIDRYAIQSNE
jgi:hypothetical protein